MLRIKKKDKELIFELKPPFNDVFFTELRSTINDFMKIGKKSFTYDFQRAGEIDKKIAAPFEEIIPVLRSGKCNLNILNASDKIMDFLPEHKLFVQKNKNTNSRSPNFKIELKPCKNPGTAIINISGEFIDQKALDDFKVYTSRLIPTVKVIILDLSNLKHISTIAIGGLIYLKVQCDKEDGKTLICNAAPCIKSTLEMSGIIQIIPVFNTLNDALNSVKSR